MTWKILVDTSQTQELISAMNNLANAQVEENQVAGNSNQEIRAPPSRRPRNSDQEEDIWNFEDSPEQRPASRKRKR